MKKRLDVWSTEPEMLTAVVDLDRAIRESGLEHSLIHLVKLRASQINGCGYCVDMHTREARKEGENEQRLYLVSAWRESPLFSPRERAALAWTERLTLIAYEDVDDDLYVEMLKHFEEPELVKLTVLVGLINVWNRVAIPFRLVHPVNQAQEAA